MAAGVRALARAVLWLVAVIREDGADGCFVEAGVDRVVSAVLPRIAVFV